MATGQMVSAGYSTVKRQRSTLSAIKPARKIQMKLSIKQRIKNWLFDDEAKVAEDSMYVEQDKLSSDGIRLQIYKASGGFVVETRGYDRKTDRNNTSMHVITDDQDLGDALGKIVMMEALR